ncbi:MAG TPA: hypothetical protein PKY82_11210 [Pyrinomonadaceae bacterium]|nr:hypothetical protein [Pyrinomonadaceae bacterium]
MRSKSLSANKNFLIGSILVGLLISGVALVPQIDLWINCGNSCSGIYAITDLDEPYYAGYLQSLMDGKPRRNSPISGAVDSETTPQKESVLSIQFLASYPPALLAQAFNLSISNLMILISLVSAFFAAVAIYWLVYLFTEDNTSAFVGTLFILFLGNLAAGQGSTFSLISPDSSHILNSLVFMRRTVPAISFPALFLFIVFVWKFFNEDSSATKLKSAFLALCSFTFCVYSYYFFWTTAFAWFFSLIGLLMIFRFEKLKENLFYLIGFGVSLIIVLIPYLILISNRGTDIDSAFVINSNHAPDLWRPPEIVSYVSTALIILFVLLRQIDLKDFQVIFLLSLNLVVIIVFNQQIITGYQIQLFHYQFFCANFLATLSVFLLIFILVKQLISFDRLKLLMILLASLPICVGAFDTIDGSLRADTLNLRRNQLLPVLERVKIISRSPEFQINNSKSVVLSFDLSDGAYFSGLEIPALTSQPILWGPHLNLIPDITKKEDIRRLNTFLYFQNISSDKLKTSLSRKELWMAIGYLGPEKTSNIYSGKLTPVTEEEIERIVDDYEKFTRNFSYQDAQNPLISLVLVNRTLENNLANLDRWYERDAGQAIGDYILYQVKLRQPQ